MFRMLRSALAALLITAAAATPALAQASAAEMLRQGMQQRGIYDGVDYDSQVWPAFDPNTGGNFDGMDLSLGIASGGGRWTMMLIVRNRTSQVYCIRPQINVQHNGSETFRMQGNQLVQPGGYLTILVATGANNGSTLRAKVPFAYWRPDFNQPANAACKNVAPAGVNEWAASNNGRDFPGSRM